MLKRNCRISQWSLSCNCVRGPPHFSYLAKVLPNFYMYSVKINIHSRKQTYCILTWWIGYRLFCKSTNDTHAIYLLISLPGCSWREFSFLFQDLLPTLTRNSVSRELGSLNEVCEALKIVELLLGFLSMTGGDARMPLVTYLQEKLKMDQNIDGHISKVSTSGRERKKCCLFKQSSVYNKKYN